MGRTDFGTVIGSDTGRRIIGYSGCSLRGWVKIFLRDRASRRLEFAEHGACDADANIIYTPVALTM